MILAAAPSRAQNVPAIDEPQVEALIEACGEADAQSMLEARMAELALTAPAPGANRTIELAVDHALLPELSPDKAAAALAAVMIDHGSDAAGRQEIRYFTLKNLAFYQALNCTALKQWYGHLIVYRDLRDKAEPSDPNRAYFARSVDKFQGKLALTLRARKRLAEKEAAVLDVVGLRKP